MTPSVSAPRGRATPPATRLPRHATRHGERRRVQLFRVHFTVISIQVLFRCSMSVTSAFETGPQVNVCVRGRRFVTRGNVYCRGELFPRETLCGP